MKHLLLLYQGRYLGEMEKFMGSRNTFAMFVPIEMSDDRTCKKHVVRW